MSSNGRNLSLAGGSGAQLSFGLQRQTMRQVDEVRAAGIVAATRDQERAFLAELALQNTGALTALEQHLTTVAPAGAARYRLIVDAYTVGAANAISRGL